MTTPLFIDSSPAVILLATLYHESTRASVQAGNTYAATEKQSRPFTEWGSLLADAVRGRLLTASEILERFTIDGVAGLIEGVHDVQLDNDEVELLARTLHECERPAVDRGWTVVKLDPPRPWLGFNDMPAAAQEGRRNQARFLLERLVLNRKL